MPFLLNEQKHPTKQMKTSHNKATLPLALIMAFRIFGLFMLMPVFSLYVDQITHATPALIGVALGIYGFTQGVLQIPFGRLSDRWGRKPVITLGLLLFALGSLIAALSTSIYGIIVGRALQGAGAIGSAVLAMVADLTPENERSKAMAIIGATIGLAFAVALVIGPAINAWFHLAGIFWATLVFALLGLVLLYTMVPNPAVLAPHPEVESEPGYFKTVLSNPELLRLDFGVFALHCMMTALFIAIPILLSNHLFIAAHHQVWLYLIIMILAFMIAMPTIMLGEKKQKLKPIFISSIILLIVCQLLFLFLPASMINIAVLLFIFFTAFTLLEAFLPSLISKACPRHAKGTAMGIYSSSQYVGIFVGGSVGGWIFGHYHFSGVFIFCVLISIIWLIIAFSMKPPIAKTDQR